ncbi:MAG TPA: gliding motility-associated C-terminal domain-containing protein, partial [Bacteroidia bacterium]|nr:gliding motility-associated C-terminal domain-containing protein [Bacteroidia bacterium]
NYSLLQEQMKRNRIKIKKLFITGMSLFSLFKTEAVNSKLQINPHDSLVVKVPNVFTPNNDGINDTWSIILQDYGVSLIDMQTTVYDRWGIPVFQTTDIREVWLGHTPTGKICNQGSYFYVITYTNGLTNKQETLKGFLELMR